LAAAIGQDVAAVSSLSDPAEPDRILVWPGAMIFIVDDDRSVRTSLTRLMRSAGYEARAFAGAEEYLDDVGGAAPSGAPPSGPAVASSSALACVILDLHLPGMSGLDLQEVINRREAPMPVIILTASEDADLRARALAGGAARVFKKPCDATTLLRAVAEAIGPAAAAPARRGGGAEKGRAPPKI
jgi:FixJ family two-component response regulator